MRSRKLLLLLALLALGVTPLVRLSAESPAQNAPVTITVGVPDFWRDIFEEKLIAEFQSANLNIKVQVVSAQLGVANVVTSGLTKHFEDMQKFASQADVLYVDLNRLSVEATQAGYFLDLAPLVSVDSSFNADDFFPAIWQSFQWNKGIWALPTGTDVYVMTYDPAEFDKAGLAYPSGQWTLDDLANAARKLAQKDPQGAVTVPGIDLALPYFDTLLMRSLLNEGFYDPSSQPNAPQFNKPTIEALLTAYFELDKEGLIGRNAPEKAAMSVNQAFRVLFNADPEKKRSGALLPGGKAGIDAVGFALSAGTQHAQEAYTFAKWLTTRPEVATRAGVSPARRSLIGAQGSELFRINIPPDVQKLVDEAVANGIPISEMRYANYLVPALQKMKTEGLDAKGALQVQEVQAINDQKAAIDKKDKNTFAVATPVPSSDLPAGKVAIKFGHASFVTPLPNQEQWNKLVEEFTANDPQVGRIDMEVGLRVAQNIDNAAKTFDCFYLPFNAVPGAKLDLLLNLDPLFGADTAFDKSDVMGNIIAQLTRDNKIWGLPITIQPSILKYDSDKFGRSNVPEPRPDWTITDFNDAVKALKIQPGDPAPFVGSNSGGAHLLILMAAYGGLPLDYRTSPPTINYTDPKVVEAIRQVLELAKDGYIKYEALGNLNFGFGRTERGTIYTDMLSAFTFGPQVSDTANAYKPVIYPKGSQYSAFSYTIGTAYISATTQYPEACYRWLSTLAKRPDLFSAMPARRSMLSDSTYVASQSPAAIALYTEVDKLLQDANTISLPSLFDAGSSPTAFLLQYWLYQAFDNYVLKDADLENELKIAEGYAKGFQECSVNLPALDTSSQESARQYLKAFGDCASKVDPRLKPLFMLIQ